MGGGKNLRDALSGLDGHGAFLYDNFRSAGVFGDCASDRLDILEVGSSALIGKEFM